jgi:ribonuclease HI
MPFFGAIDHLRRITNQNRNPLNCCCLMNGRLILFRFSTETSTSRSKMRNHSASNFGVQGESGKHLDGGKWVTHDEDSDHYPMSDLVAYVDGGSFGNPGPSGIGVVIDGSTNGTIRIAKWIGHQDNNVAEYLALLEALQCALGLRARTLHVFSDSEVVVRQMRGEYNCRSPRLYSLHWICRKLARSLDFSISHVRREDNTVANGLANSAARNGEATANVCIGQV